MKFLVDAQLPPVLAARLTAMGHESWHIGSVAALDASDRTVCGVAREQGARERGWVIVTKDADFLRLAGSPPLCVLWVRIGNCGNARLVDLLLGRIEAVVAAFVAGETLVELR